MRITWILCSCLLFLFAPTLFAQEQKLLVGLHALDINPKIGIPLAGYGSTDRRLKNFFDWKGEYKEASLFKPSEGFHSLIRSKVMFLKMADKNLVFVSLDTIGTEDRFIKDIAANLAHLGVKEEEIIVSATHTHGGPGTLSNRLPLQAIAVDFYKEKNYRYIVTQVTLSIVRAYHSLREAELFKSKAIIEGVQRNKWRRKDEQHYDKRASFLVARDRQTGAWLGGMVNFSIHGGTMPVDLMLYSSDINGAIEIELEKELAHKNSPVADYPVFLFMNGAEGDVGSEGERSVAAIDRLSKLFVQQAAPSLDESVLTPVATQFSVQKKKLFVGMPGLPMKGCQKGLFGKLPEWMKVSIYKLLPTHSYISIAQVGDITYMTYPGEPSTQIGYDLQALALARGHIDPQIISLANDYMTYFTTRKEYREFEYDSCSSMYGWQGSERIMLGHQDWL
jgi:hypothetical protein